MQTVIDTSSLPSIARKGRIVILKSKWYPDQVESMAKACASVLEDYGYERIEQHTLPGSLELPLAARNILTHDVDKTVDAIICFGIIVKGDTLHFELISNECMRGLGEVMHEFDRPIVVEVIPVFEMQHALDRSGDNEHNKGYEAAACAVEMVAWRQNLAAS